MEELSSRLNGWRSKFEERVSGSLAHYFDPQQGTFTERVHRLTKPDIDGRLTVQNVFQPRHTMLDRYPTPGTPSRIL